MMVLRWRSSEVLTEQQKLNRLRCVCHLRGKPVGTCMLTWRVHIALIRAKLEPYLGYLHAIAFGRLSLICDFMEPYRYLIDNFVLENAREFRPKDFALKTEFFSKKRRGKREYLADKLQRALFEKLDSYFNSKVEIPRIRVDKNQEIETLINEEAFATFSYPYSSKVQ